MAYYVLAHFSVTNPDMYQQYPPVAAPTVLQYGGRFLAVTGRGQQASVIEGTPPHAAPVLIEFQTQAAAERWYNSPEYQAVIGLRTDSTDRWVLGVPAVQPPGR